MNAYWSAGFNLLSAVIGAVIGGDATVWAQSQSAKYQRRHERDAEALLIRGFVQAIEAELKGIWGRYTAEIGPNLGDLSTFETAKVFPLHQSYFVVFDSNASLIGRIPDQHLREQIIGTYVQAKAFVDTMHFYERLIEDGSGPSEARDTSAIRSDRQDVIVAYSQQLKANHLRLKAQYHELRKSLRDFLG